MNILAAQPIDPKLGSIIKLAVLAVGGQGGGVLTGWIEDVARAPTAMRRRRPLSRACRSALGPRFTTSRWRRWMAVCRSSR